MTERRSKKVRSVGEWAAMMKMARKLCAAAEGRKQLKCVPRGPRGGWSIRFDSLFCGWNEPRVRMWSGHLEGFKRRRKKEEALTEGVGKADSQQVELR